MSRTSHPSGDEIATTLPWRRSQLRRAGFGARLAAEVAADTRYDLHEILLLTQRGCLPELAVRILAPVGDGPR
jgi:hypothetical protein